MFALKGAEEGHAGYNNEGAEQQRVIEERGREAWERGGRG